MTGRQPVVASYPRRRPIYEADCLRQARALIAARQRVGKPVRPVGTTQSDFDGLDGLGPVSPPAEADASALRAGARAGGDALPPWGEAYTGSETSKARRSRS